LHCLGGDAAPADVLHDAHRVDKLTKGALAQLWDVLEPCLTPSLPPDVDAQLGAFCRRHEMAEADLAHVIRIARFVLRAASAINLPARGFHEDLRTIWPGIDPLHQVLLSRYDVTRLALRGRLLADALTKHGNVLQNLEWRVDNVIADSGAARLELPVGIVTLAYRYRDETSHLTLQMTPDQLMRAAQVFTSLAQQARRLIPPEPAYAPAATPGDSAAANTYGASPGAERGEAASEAGVGDSAS